jgi:hypothetical protein
MFKTATLDKQVHTTTDYFLFKPMQGNRQLNKLHLKRLKDAIEKNYLFTVIIVNENYEIIDGQHRFQCISELSLPLHYIICKGYGLLEVQLLNANSKNWNTEDYLTGYIDMGFEDYMLYKQFKDKYKFDHQSCITILSSSVRTSLANQNMYDTFKMGKFKIVDYQYSEGIAKKIWLMNGIYDGFLRKYFVFAIMRLLKNPEFELTEFIAKLKLQPSAMTDCSSVDQYITLIEEIYNYKRRDKVNLRFIKS